MGSYNELRNLLRKAAGERNALTFWQGTVKSVEGCTCTVDVGNLHISGVRLRATEKELENELLITPAVGSSVIVGSLSGDYSNLAVLRCDQVESIKIGNGKKGGLLNVGVLVDKLNEFISKYNAHVHMTPNGESAAIIDNKLDELKGKDNYEDKTLTH